MRKVILFIALFLCAPIAQLHAQEIVVRVLNAHNGKPDKRQPVGYAFDPRPSQQNEIDGVKFAHTKNGQVSIQVPIGTKEIELGTFGYYPCDRTLYYDMATIMKAGVIEPCSRALRLSLKPVPGTVVLFIDVNDHWWQRGED